MKTPVKGQIVYVYHLVTHDSQSARNNKPVPRATIREMMFYQFTPNYCNSGLRWYLKLKESPALESYCTACKPEHVFATEPEARAALNTRIRGEITKLMALLTDEPTGATRLVPTIFRYHTDWPRLCVDACNAIAVMQPLSNFLAAHPQDERELLKAAFVEEYTKANGHGKILCCCFPTGHNPDCLIHIMPW